MQRLKKQLHVPQEAALRTVRAAERGELESP